MEVGRDHPHLIEVLVTHWCGASLHAGQHGRLDDGKLLKCSPPFKIPSIHFEVQLRAESFSSAGTTLQDLKAY